LSARIVAVANLLDGLWHVDRCGPNEPEELARHLALAAGRWLDPELVALALEQRQDLVLHLRQAEVHRPAMADLLRDF
jgi:response regulator RpfG family c-di-GMP phosphodiesterase